MKLSKDRMIPHQAKDPFFVEHFKRYEFTQKYIKNKVVLDLGCGEGYGSFYLSKYAKKVIAIDLDQKVIEFAHSKYQRKNLKYLAAEATAIPFPSNHFDVIISLEVIEHVKNYFNYLAEIKRVLKKEGVLIISTPNKDNYRAGTSPYHEKEFSSMELIELISKYGFTVSLLGQKFKNQNYGKEEKAYFKRYNNLTFGGNKIIKKLLHKVHPNIKAKIYLLFWKPIPQISESSIVIEKTDTKSALTLVAVCKKR